MTYPAGRMSITEFRKRAGIAKTTFYDNYRGDPEWIRRMDLRQDPNGRLHVCERSAEQFVQERLGQLAFSASERAEPLLRRCPHCDELIRPKAKVCKHCGLSVPPPADGGRDSA